MSMEKDVFVYFNNTMSGDAPRNLAELKLLLDRLPDRRLPTGYAGAVHK
jgi:uncharacterized protein YecE (DUF72 family)